MKDLLISATDCTPEVYFDSQTAILRIEGESYPENVTHFYKPLHDWLREVLAKDPALKVHFFLTYLNTSSSKSILDILDVLEDYHHRGGSIEVVWRYQEGIEVMMETGEEFGEGLKLPFRLEEVS